MGSKCGTLGYVPFEETWPPRENNLGGPYWERRLSGKGIYAPDYQPPFQGMSKYYRAGRQEFEEDEGRSGGGFGLFIACVLAFTAIGCFAMGIASCMVGDEGGPGHKRRSSGGVAARKPRGRPQWARRAGVSGDKGQA